MGLRFWSISPSDSLMFSSGGVPGRRKGKNSIQKFARIIFLTESHRTLRERSFQHTQDTVRFAQPELDNLIGPRL
jgi:hypothetical protein